MKRLLLLLTLGLAPVFCQTPCIDAAKAGQVGSCLQSTVKVTNADAQFVPVQVVKGYVVDPQLPYNFALEFATKEQALAIIELVKFAAPGSNLVLKDIGGSFSFPPFRMLKYFNDGGLFAPRLYEITGTVSIDGKDLPVYFEPGWFLNVTKLIYRGSNDAGDFGFAYGADRVVVVAQFGGAQVKWVGLDGTVTR